jgi:hypothetical protein
MTFLIRFGRGAPVHSPTLCRAPRGAARATDALARRAMAGFAAFVALLFFAIPAQADEIEPETAPKAEPAPNAEPEAKPESGPEPDAMSEKQGISEPNWIPSIDVGFEIFDYNTETTVQNFINAPAWAGAQHEAERQLMFRIGGELMGPAFEGLPGRPRLFVQGGVQIRAFSGDEIFAIGDPGVAAEPDQDVRSYGLRGNFKGENLPGDFEGQGSDVFGTFQDPSWYAAVGVAFSVPIASNLLLQIKPSLEYSLEKIDLVARLTTVNELDPHEDPDFITPTRDFVVVRSRSERSATDHSVGAGLELALVLFRNLRPIRVSLYTEARFMWLLGGSTTTLGDRGGVASFSVVRDDFGIKGGGGVRLSWVGFD